MSSQKDEVRQSYRGVISVLRFLRRINRLGEVDKFASAPDPDSAIRVIKDALSLIYRSITGNICYRDKIDPGDVPLYKYLCGSNCVKEYNGQYYIEVRCPKRPTDEELARLHRELSEGKVRQEYIAALALAAASREP